MDQEEIEQYKVKVEQALSHARTLSKYDSLRYLTAHLYDESMWTWESFDHFLTDYDLSPATITSDEVLAYFAMSTLMASGGEVELNGFAT